MLNVSKAKAIANQVLNCFIITFVSVIHPGNPAAAKPCYPSDPTGNNPQNPCPTFPPPGVRSDTFIGGQARPVREIPTVNSPTGRVIAAPSGYWTGSNSNNGVRTVTTNQGQVFQFNSN